MTTLVVTSSWPRTRDEIAGTFVRTDALHRAQKGARVVVAAPEGPGEARTGAGLEVVDVAHAGLFGTPGAAARLLARPHRALGLGPWSHAVARVVRDTMPSSIVAHWLLPAGALACVFGVPVEAIAHGGDVRLLEAMPRALARATLESIAARATVRAVSPGIADRLRVLAPDLPVVIAPLPLATDVVFDAARARGARLRATFGEELCVVAARLVPEKRIERVVPRVAARGGRLVLVGDGPTRTRVLAEARSARVDVLAVGALPHEQALGWLAAADEVLAPLALGEGAPTVVREAQALGVPVTVLG